jgi:hypothetical protein
VAVDLGPNYSVVVAVAGKESVVLVSTMGCRGHASTDTLVLLGMSDHAPGIALLCQWR